MAWLLVVIIAWFFLGGGTGEGAGTIVDDVLNAITRGARVTHATYNAAGVVDVDPRALADQAGVGIDQYALARALSSEEGRADNLTKAAVGWCMVNEAARRGQSISEILLHAVNRGHSGRFGTQKDIDTTSPNFGHSDRYASTALDPYAGDLEIAAGILDGSIADPTGGAQQFDRPAGENADRVAANRIASGAELVDVPGADPGLRFWRT